MKKWMGKFLKDEKGINTVEIVVIVAIAIGLALIFREQLTNFVNGIFASFNAEQFAVPTPKP